MVNWNNLQNATSPDNKPTPGWLFNEIIQDVKHSPKDCPDVAEYLMQCVCSDQLNIQLKAVLCVKHLSAEDVTFQQYMQACPGAIKILEDIAAPPIVPQARSLEPQEVKTVRDATTSSLVAIRTPHTVEKSTEAASLKQKIQGFGNFEPPKEEDPNKPNGVVGQVGEFVADSVGDMVDDFREKGAVGALKDATIDALDLVLDGVDAVWGWVAGKGADDAPRICQPTGGPAAGATGSMMLPGGGFVGGGVGGAPSGFAPPPQQPASASNHYAAAFGGGVVGANNPVQVGGPPAPAALPALAPAPAPQPKAPPPAPVDLLSMDEEQPKAQAAPAASMDLLGGMDAPATGPAPAQTTANMLDLM